jgi:hypothetical protein
MKHPLMAVLLMAAFAWPLRGEESRFDPSKLAKDVAPFIEEGTFVIARADLMRWDYEKLVARLVAITGADPAAFSGLVPERERKRVKALQDAGARDVFVVFGLSDLFTEGGALVLPLGEKADRKAISDLLGDSNSTPKQVGKALLLGSKDTVERLSNNVPIRRPELVEAFAAAEDGIVQVAFLLPPSVRRALEEMLPELPPDLGGGKMQTFTRGLRWAALRINAIKGHVRLTVGCADEEAAQNLERSLVRVLAAVARLEKVNEVFPGADRWLPGITPKASGDRLNLLLDDNRLREILAPHLRAALLPKLSEARLRARSTENLKKILVALHEYHDKYGKFPAAASYDKAGKPLLSWRVHLLPFLGLSDLYKEFHLDEPWDSAHNIKLVGKMPAAFDSTFDPRKATAGLTTYMGVVGNETMFTNKESRRVADVTDGLSHTIFVVDADDSRAAQWTKPADLQFEPKSPRKGLSSRFSNAFMVGLADGSVRLVSNAIAPEALRALLTCNGGEAVDLP